MKRPFVVKVPASSGNLGPGFDVLSLALSLYNELHVSVEKLRFSPPRIEVHGEGEGVIPANSRNIIFRCIGEVFKRARRPIPALRLVSINRIPLQRGLGSSSVAMLCGFLAANHLLDEPFSRHEILSMATEIEGHPDNLASSLFGGIQASLVTGRGVMTMAWPVPKVKFVLAIPDFQLSTKFARTVVPRAVPLKNAIANLSSVAMMSAAFKTDLDLLRTLLNDRWHEPYRCKLVPGFKKVKEAALRAGSYGVTLSGAGPTVLSFTPKDKAHAVANAMNRAFRRAGIRCQILELKADLKGAQIK